MTESTTKKTDIETMLGAIRTYGTREKTKNGKMAEELLALLSGEKGWTHAQGLSFYEFIIRRYIDNEEDQKMLLAVSGISEGYRSIGTATKRREKFLNSYNDTLGKNKYGKADPDQLNYAEDVLLTHVAEKIQEAIDNQEISLLIQHWKSDSQPTPGSAVEWKKAITQFLIKNITLLLLIILVPLLLGMIFLEIRILQQQDNMQAPPIQQISAKPEIVVAPGKKQDLNLSIFPSNADWGELKYKIDNDQLVALTWDGYVVGLDYLEKEWDSTQILIWGKGAEPITVNVTVIKPDSARNEPTWDYYDVPDH